MVIWMEEWLYREQPIMLIILLIMQKLQKLLHMTKNMHTPWISMFCCWLFKNYWRNEFYFLCRKNLVFSKSCMHEAFCRKLLKSPKYLYLFLGVECFSKVIYCNKKLEEWYRDQPIMLIILLIMLCCIAQKFHLLCLY